MKWANVWLTANLFPIRNVLFCWKVSRYWTPLRSRVACHFWLISQVQIRFISWLVMNSFFSFSENSQAPPPPFPRGPGPPPLLAPKNLLEMLAASLMIFFLEYEKRALLKNLSAIRQFLETSNLMFSTSQLVGSKFSQLHANEIAIKFERIPIKSKWKKWGDLLC